MEGYEREGLNTVGRRYGGIGERRIKHCRKEVWRDRRERD